MLLDDAFARQWLENVYYYRLSAYWYPARTRNSTGEVESTFKPGTTFSDVAALYEADRKLRTLVHDGMERIEIALRSQLVNHLVLKDANDSLAHLNPSHFRPTFDHQALIGNIDSRIARAQNHNEAVKHYVQNYGSRFPMWVVAEVLDFSDTSKLFASLRGADQRTIAENLGLTIDLSLLSRNQADKVRRSHPLAAWLHQMTVIRNTCAHHARLWNRSFSPCATPALRTNPSLTLLPHHQSERVFGALVVMAQILRTVSPGTTWPNKVTELLNREFLTNALVSQESLGIPSSWDKRSFDGQQVDSPTNMSCQ